jgi:hypothetical protein
MRALLLAPDRSALYRAATKYRGGDGLESISWTPELFSRRRHCSVPARLSACTLKA